MKGIALQFRSVGISGAKTLRGLAKAKNADDKGKLSIITEISYSKFLLEQSDIYLATGWKLEDCRSHGNRTWENGLDLTAGFRILTPL
jgi:hypothetical protein